MKVNVVKISLMSSIVSLNLMAVDLGSVMTSVVRTNPKVIQKKKEYNSIYETLKISQGDFFLPSIDLSASVNKVKTKYKEPAEDDAKATNRSLTLSITENLFNGFGTVSDIDAKKAALASKAFSYLQTVNEEALKASKVYLDLARHKEMLNIELDSFYKHKKILEAVKARNRSGVGVVGDLQEIVAKTNLAYANYVAESKNLKASQIAMNKLLGRAIDANSVSVLTTVGENLSYSLSQAINFALTHNPTIFVQKYNVIQARHNQKRDEKEFLPKIDLTIAKQYRDGVDDDTKIKRKIENLSGGVSLSWNLFRGFKDTHQKRKDISLIHVEQEKYNAVKRDLVEEIELAWMSYKMQEKEYNYLSNYVKNADAKLQTNAKLFQIGKKSLFEYLSSQTDFNSAKEKLINCKYDLLFTKLRVLKALGILVDMVDPRIKREVGVVSDGLHDYEAMAYTPDTLPVREDTINQNGSFSLNDIIGFDSYKIVSPVKRSYNINTNCNTYYNYHYSSNSNSNSNNSEFYDEEYVAPRTTIKRYGR